KLTSILRRGFTAIGAMSAHQLDLLSGQPRAERIAIGGSIVEQTLRLTPNHARIQQRFDQGNFVGTSAGDRRGHRQPMPFAMDHDLGPLAAFGLADEFAPFFAEEKVPSAVDSFQLSWPWRSSC